MQNTKVNRGDLLNKVSSGIELLTKQENSKELFQLKKLAYKIQNKESYYVFCGHFSAGKSSLLNDLLQVEKLPTSPIPTSANVVKLKNGQNDLLITLKNGDMYQIEDEIEVEDLKKLAKDSSSIIELEWSQDSFKIPEGVVLIDTPGIDSTDVDHLEATNSVIHLADCIFYLMDYQHVHSKTNIDFIHSLIEKNDRVCLVITCIDKHDETELTFEAFKDGVISNLKKQGLEKLTIFYLSTRDKSVQNNEYQSFIGFLNNLYDQQETMQIDHDSSSFETIMKEQMQHLENEQIELDENFPQYKADYNEILTEISVLNNVKVQFEEDCSQTTQQVLTNSNITPFEMRDLASTYLESEISLLNKGFFQSRKKLEIASDNAKQLFMSKVKELTEKQIEYFIKEAAKSAVNRIEEIHIDLSQHDHILEPKLSELTLCPKPTQLINNSGNYLLQYTKEVSDGIKAVYRKAINEFIQSVLMELSNQSEKRLKELNSKKDEMGLIVSELEAIDLKNHRLIQSIQEVKYILEQNQVQPSNVSNILPIRMSVSELIKKDILKDDIQLEVENEDRSDTNQIDAVKYSNEEIQSKYEIADLLLSKLAENKYIKSKIEVLIEKRNQIKSNEYTIALFGAFSSGKTSYINTLLGNRVLPVSPHPTTAAICKIKKSTVDSANKTAEVTYKSFETLQEEFLDFFKKWGIDSNGKEWIQTLKIVITKQKEKVPTDALIYAESVCHNYEEMSHLLGTTQSYHLDDYVRVISEEVRACFVKESTVYYDCELTLNGVVLVDTPGGNSIHSRHTELAFDYLKKADLILYVAHYQHAFTRQDESFLMQIGRMRESFDSDKVYFVLNASDLAKDADEITIVQNFFINQLTKLGVRFPSVFAVSSMLQMKGYNTSPIGLDLEANYSKLNNKIQNYFQYEIANEVFKTFMNDMLVIEKILIDTIKRIERIKVEKEQFLSELNTIRNQVQSITKNTLPTSLPRSFEKENEQLLFFIEKRIEYRMRDLFPYFFNPSIFNHSTKNSKQLVITKIREFIYEVLEEIMKELRITGYRLEKFLMSEINMTQNRLIEEIHSVQTEFIVQKNEVPDLETIQLDKPDQFFNVNSFENLKSYYKNPKSFFVENMKENMIDECISQLKTPLKSYLTSMEQIFITHYQIQFIDTIAFLYNKCEQQVENDIEQSIEATNNLDENIVQDEVLKLFKNLI